MSDKSPAVELAEAIEGIDAIKNSYLAVRDGFDMGDVSVFVSSVKAIYDAVEGAEKIYTGDLSACSSEDIEVLEKAIEHLVGKYYDTENLESFLIMAEKVKLIAESLYKFIKERLGKN